MLDHDWIASHIPHQGSMCLLASVQTWDTDRIHCRASSHRLPDNPLRAHGRLGAACAIEYAAQAMAAHGALLASANGFAPRVGYLVSARGVQLLVSRLDDIVDDLMVAASCIMSGENNILYQFNVSAAGRVLAQGRAAVILDADALGLTKGNAL